MPGEPLLLAIATVASVVAGFTGLSSALVRHPAMRLRQRAIVSTSFNVVFEALLPPIAFLWLDDERAAIVAASVVVAVYTTIVVVVRGRQFARAGMARSRSAVMLFALGPTAALLFWANAIVFASVAVYALALCIQLSVAAISFYTLISAAED